MKIHVIYEDKNFLAINKPAGLLVHSAKTVKVKDARDEEPTVTGWIIKNYPEIKKVGDDPEYRPGIVHRLDKDTSGVLLIAKNQEYFEYLKNLFQSHKVKKIYNALVYGKLEERRGIITKPISIKKGSLKRTVHAGKMTKEAITEYKLLKEYKKDGHIFSFVEVIPRTGRTHQIRIHMSSIRHPIVGDSLYGPKSNPLNLHRQFLHARSVEFSTADGMAVKVEADLPEDLEDVLRLFRHKS